MLNNLVVPAVRSQEAPIRERGFCCLGLCCLLNKNLAEENLALFLHGFAKGHPSLQTIALQIIADILITHPSLLAEPATINAQDTTMMTEQPPAENKHIKMVLKAFNRSLKSDDPAVQSTGATALSKAMLSRLITDTDLLKQLVIAYFDPDTAANAQLRQSLSYFLPVYCHSRAENAARMGEVACSVIAKLSTLREAFLEDADANSDGDAEGGMVKLGVIGQMVLDWTDPRKIVGFAEAAGATQSADEAGETHFLLAEHVLDRLVTSQVSREEKKVLFSMLGKLHLPEGGCGGERLAALLELLTEAVDTAVAVDATSRNTLTKLKNLLLKQMHDVATAERGGGGAEETVLEEQTVLETTQLTLRPGATGIADSVTGVDEEDDDDITQLQQTVRDTTIGAPDAEGTRMALGGDTELLSDEDFF